MVKKPKEEDSQESFFSNFDEESEEVMPVSKRRNTEARRQ